MDALSGRPSHARGLHLAAAALLLPLLVLGCSDDLPVAPPPTFVVQAEGDWPDTLTMRDTVRVAVRSTDAAGRTLKLRDVRWASSDARVLTVVPDDPPPAGTRADTLGAPLSARVIAHGHGRATITVTVAQEGVGSATHATEAITVLARWIAVDAGGTMTCALSVDHDAYCWGSGGSGLGIGHTAVPRATVPTRVAGGLRFAQLSVGDEHACGITVDELLYCWGDNDLGAVGDGTFIDRYVPAFVALGRPALSVSAGNSVTCVVTPSSQNFRAQNTYCWGHTDVYGRAVGSGTVPCGSATISGFDRGACHGRPSAPVQSGEFDPSEDQMPLRQVSVGAGVACGLHERQSTVWCWGRNSSGQTGAPPFARRTYAMLIRGELAGTLQATDVSAGAYHACAIGTGGVAYCWGDNFRGQLGSGALLGDGTSRFAPVETNVRFTAISAAGGLSSDLVAYTCALAVDGVIHCWGDNRFGQLGRPGGNSARAAPVSEPAGGPVRWTAVSAAAAAFISRSSFGQDLPSAHACGLTDDGAIYCWGRGQEGQLGTGATTSVSVPTRIAEP